MPQIDDKLPTHVELGFNPFLSRPFAPAAFRNQGGISTSGFGELNYDQVQTSGSLGDVIQVGGDNVIIDGANRRILVNDESGTPRILLGNDEGGF